MSLILAFLEKKISVSKVAKYQDLTAWGERRYKFLFILDASLFKNLRTE